MAEISDWRLVELTNSNSGNKRFAAKFINEKTNKRKTVNFGDKRYENYTMHHDKKRRSQYHMRHETYLTADRTTAATLSFWVLWGSSTSLKRNLKFYVENVLRGKWDPSIIKV